ncbi:hypothetical protein CTI12_AA150920 [Artemisia annua]|uniref:Polyadenylate-binding protein 1-B-binding protein n=1 Tax=Artemisia annua TaxID=35608 RepID=A0A2U1PHN7_ARTAN|nr:hypothetical protein CTI12_AA150920 [Artemisia annua]
MDRPQEELQFLGLFGIYKETIKTIISWRKIFTQITLTFILPLAFIFLAHMEVSNLISGKIMNTDFQKHLTRPGTLRYNKLTDALRSEWITYWLLKATYFTFLIAFSLLSTSAVVYTTACIYASRNLTFTSVCNVVPKVWKRLIVTFLCAFVVFFIYNMLAFFMVVSFMLLLPADTFGDVVFHIMLIFYFIGFVYISIIWQMACVVSVLDSSYGVKAMMKSKNLIKGKRWVAIFIFSKIHLSFFAVQIIFELFVVYGHALGVWRRVGFAVLCLLVLSKLFLFGFVAQTILYLVCKSYHHENVDKSSLADLLEGYLGDYAALSADDNVQLEQTRV